MAKIRSMPKMTAGAPPKMAAIKLAAPKMKGALSAPVAAKVKKTAKPKATAARPKGLADRLNGMKL